jgi:hypothetical protein
MFLRVDYFIRISIKRGRLQTNISNNKVFLIGDMPAQVPQLRVDPFEVILDKFMNKKG